ncbi:MAG: AAA domain-containing protein [Acidobacteria bacterium]|nr:AAA domain-containing protein [Acidobacteriota bacterium]
MALKKAASVNTESTRRPTAAPAKPVKRTRRTLQRKAGRKGSRVRKLLRATTNSAPDELRDRLAEQVIGQDDALDAITSSWARLLSGLRDPERPLLTALLMGPTGVGKTETARALAAALFGDDRALHRINCEEYAHGHEVAKLLGSPPGYVGADIEPLLSQRRIDKPHFERREVDPEAEVQNQGSALIDSVHDPEHGLHSILLFDEVEKAHPTLWNALLGILDDGRVTLGNNATTDLRRSVILMTTNVGSREMGAAVGRVPLGFASTGEEGQAEDLAAIAQHAAREVFPAEFLNRFDQTLVYRPLAPEDLGLIFDKFLAAVNQRAHAQAGVPLLIKASAKAKALVIERGTEPALGARPLRRAIERLIVDPVSQLLAGAAIGAGDVIEVEAEGDDLAFYRLPRSADTIVA